MAAQLQLRRGTSGQNDTFTGAQGEISVDSTNKTVRVHDGSTPGGSRLATYDELTALPKAIDIIGAWDPSTNTVVGDPNNTSLTKDTAPSGYADPDQLAYYVNEDGSFDLINGPAPEFFSRGDIIVWSSTANGYIATRGSGGTIRSQDVDYDPTGTSLVATNVQAAINELDATHIHTAGNVGAGEGKFVKDITAGALNVRSLKAGPGVTISTSADELDVEIRQTDLDARGVVVQPIPGISGGTVQEVLEEIVDIPTVMLDKLFPVGSVTLRMDAINPDTIYGGTWALITGDASLSFGDGTAQSVTPSGDNNPNVPLVAHTHTMNHDHGAVNTSSDTHTHSVRSGSRDSMDHYYKLSRNRGFAGINSSEASGSWTNSSTLIKSDAHSHSVNLPNYTGSTGSSGTSSPTLDVRGARISINVWQRTV